MPSSFLHFCYPLSVSSKVTMAERYLHLYPISAFTPQKLSIWYIFFFLPAGLHLHSPCFWTCTVMDLYSFSLWQRKADPSKSDSVFEQKAGKESHFLNSPGLWHGGRAILSTASQTYIISQCLISWITHRIQINGKCQSTLVYGSPCCHCCSSVLLLDFHV